MDQRGELSEKLMLRVDPVTRGLLVLLKERYRLKVAEILRAGLYAELAKTQEAVRQGEVFVWNEEVPEPSEEQWGKVAKENAWFEGYGWPEHRGRTRIG
jgi:hypothetical protein